MLSHYRYRYKNYMNNLKKCNNKKHSNIMNEKKTKKTRKNTQKKITYIKAQKNNITKKIHLTLSYNITCDTINEGRIIKRKEKKTWFPTAAGDGTAGEEGGRGRDRREGEIDREIER